MLTGTESTWKPHTSMTEIQNGTVSLERSLFLTKLDIYLPYDPAILPLEVKTHVHTKHL